MFSSADKSKLGKLKGWQYLLVAGLCLFSACARAPVPAKEKVILWPEVTAIPEPFKKAERLFHKQAYSDALEIYQEYLKQSPRGPLADIALMKAGTIHMAVEDYPRARKTFQRLVSDYPQSLFVEDARFNVMLTYYREQDYSSAIQYARSILGLARTPDQEFRIRNLMAHTYAASSQFKDAIRSYMDAYRLASQQGRAEILGKVKEAVTQLKEEELNLLLEEYTDRPPGGYLRLQLARHYASDDRLEPAMKVLSDFMSLFPDHDEFETAMAFMEQLVSRLLVDPFAIGCILPLSGPYGTFGNRALTGIEYALQQFNSQPDVHPIRLVIQDSKGDPNEAAMAVETLVLKHRVVGIIGPMITSESAAIRAQALQVPIITLTQKSGITALGDYVFRNFLTLSLQIKALVEYAVQDLGLERFAILYPDERYGVSFMNRFWDELIQHDAEVVGIESYEPEQTDFSDVIKKLVGLYYPRPEGVPEEQVGDEEVLPDLVLESAEAAGDQDELLERDEEEPKPIVDFQAVFIPDSFEKVGLIVPQLSYHDVTDVLLLGTNLWHSEKLIQMAGGYMQGAVVPDGFFVNSPAPKVQGFVRSYKEIFGMPPAFLETQAYDTAWILFQAVNQPQVDSRHTLKMALLEVKDFPGVTGPTSFDETGDVEKDIYLLQVKRGHFVQIKP